MATETKDELAARRAREEQEKLDADPSRTNGGDPAGDDGKQSIEDMANGADEEHGEEDDGQLFVLEEGKTVTLGTLIKRGTPVEYEFKLSGKAIPGAKGMGLISFADPERTLIVPGRAGKVEVDPTYAPDGSVKKVNVRVHFKPTTAYDARTEAGRVALRGEE